MVTTGIERIAERDHREAGTVFSALMHHYHGDNLRACFQALDNHKAPGIDGVTKMQSSRGLYKCLCQRVRSLI
jgi:hypothetical protein